MLFFVTFDLNNASQPDYDRVYAWAHGTGGYRYFQFPDGTWGRLPSTSIVAQLTADSTIAARAEFLAVLRQLGLASSHLAITVGHPATLAEPVTSPPAYAIPRTLAEMLLGIS